MSIDFSFPRQRYHSSTRCLLPERVGAKYFHFNRGYLPFLHLGFDRYHIGQAQACWGHRHDDESRVGTDRLVRRGLSAKTDPRHWAASETPPSRLMLMRCSAREHFERPAALSELDLQLTDSNRDEAICATDAPNALQQTQGTTPDAPTGCY
jgi:hypothetical protein